MRYRIYFKTQEDEILAKEVEADGVVYRVCDDHGRVIFGEPCPKKERFIPSFGGKEPLAY